MRSNLWEQGQRKHCHEVRILAAGRPADCGEQVSAEDCASPAGGEYRRLRFSLNFEGQSSGVR